MLALTGLLALVSAVAAATSLERLWGVALSLAVLTLFGWLVLWARRVNGALQLLGEDLGQARDQQRRSAERIRRVVRDTNADLAASTYRDLDKIRSTTAAGTATVNRLSNDLLGATKTGFDRIAREVYTVRTTVQRTPSLTVELGRQYDRLVKHDRLMPELGGWAFTPGSAVWMVDLVGHSTIGSILECGAGGSTVWLAAALEHRGGEGHIVSLESSESYAAETRARLEEVGLAHRATVLYAPLVETPLEGRPAQPWYDLSVLPEDVPPVDLLFVDGPIGSVSREARYPAFPQLSRLLADEALVILDDSARPDERAIAEKWLAEEHSGHTLEQVVELDRTIVFRASKA
jgi:predicted O-methyltransferase YrrM